MPLSNDSTILDLGLSLMDEEIDRVIFSTNQFLTSGTSTTGPFWWILQISMCLAALFSIIFAASLAYKMMYKNEPLDVMKLMRPLAISIVLCWWYPADGGSIFKGRAAGSFSVLDALAWVPNALGSYTHDLYEAESEQILQKFQTSQKLLAARDEMYRSVAAETATAQKGVTSTDGVESLSETNNAENMTEIQKLANELLLSNISAGLVILLDKVIMFLSLVLFRVGWWTTIYGQQILLGMLTIFGPIQWAFSILPKWEGAWAKWITRYLTVHFYGVALYFVGFYVLLLFDIGLEIQIEELKVYTASATALRSYVMNAFFTSAYMIVASIVALKCLDFVPDIASWMIPEGETTIAMRAFGSGIAGETKGSAQKVLRSI